MSKNLALVIDSPLNIVLKELPVGEPREDEVLIRVQYVALCGSDVKLYTGTYTAPHQYPVVIGHEWVGIIVKAGEKALNRWSAGDLVTGDCSLYCGTCRYCGVNNNHCLSIEKKGITIDGGCASYIIANQRHLYLCPPMADIKALALSEPLSVAVHGIVNRVPLQKLHGARKALILGCGGIGLMSLFTLLEYDIPEITVVDIEREKLDMADSFGFPNVKTVRADLTGPDCVLRDDYDLIVEAAGSTQTLKKSIELAAPCAHIVCIGHQKPAELDFGAVVKKSLTLHASNGSTGGFEKAIDIIQKRQAHISSLITAVVPLEQAPHFFAQELENPRNIKILIDLTGE